ncbi:MAG TPA: toxic anion resistance protein [Spirochaetota bacterium]|nr:toxic anion resistance protein [Spirochaetota bacterium]HOS41278.1 toxic anion resistance protein [Spirochaetota bacterium]HPI22062.1 toxic anion resistance protein [Spirochaetota bacterium]HPU86801.1 toxic anion resistance protein [Spirochaetota bacterium]
MGDTERLVQKNEEVVDVSKLSPEDMKKVQEIAKQIDIDDSQAVVTYGVGAQREISSFSDTILNEVRTKDTGFVGDILTNLVVNIKDLDVDSLSTGGSFVSKIPVIGQLVDSVKRFIIRYEKTSLQIEKITDELDKARMQLLKDIALLDNMYEKNQEYLKNLDLYIAAGQIKLKELQEKTIPEMKAKADASNDPADAQKFQDLAMAVNRFEKKVHDMKLSRMIAIQTAPQVRMIQGSNQTLVEKIQTSILNTIPLWKNQIVIAITLFRQNKALKLQKEITKTTNDLLSKNAELLKQSSIDIAKETERGIVDIETLKKVNNDLITTIEETLKIQAEGRVKRAQAEKELIKLETDLKQKLTTVKESK